jgi:hypothetical protein
MFYFNDFPRFLEQLSGESIVQNSCLHGGASISSLLEEGNGMYPQFETDAAVMTEWHGEAIHDYGACTVEDLLFGFGFDAAIYGPDYEIHDNTKYSNTTNLMKNACKEDNIYRDYNMMMMQNHSVVQPHWDYVLINDNTRNPARGHTRNASLLTLLNHYVPWLRATGSTPVFLWTHAYTTKSTEERNMTGLDDVANFTSLTGVGYREYVQLLQQYLPHNQQPRIAPVGLAFLTIYEEDPDLWKMLFHSDHIHASPSGTFLQGCVVYHTLTGRLPDLSLMQSDDDVMGLWRLARMMQHAWELPNPFPTYEQTKYLYSVAERVVNGHVPSAYIDYQHGEVAHVVG